MTQVDIAALSPQVVWQHFQTLCTIPRPSKHEQQLREFLQNWAESRNLETYVDEVGNLIIRKNATLGKEHVPGVILQGHLDMVTQANT
ncbi:MAG: aminoacyl-histidine dipeptidase, partial [Acinetobacter baumannii]